MCASEKPLEVLTDALAFDGAKVQQIGNLTKYYKWQVVKNKAKRFTKMMTPKK